MVRSAPALMETLLRWWRGNISATRANRGYCKEIELSDLVELNLAALRLRASIGVILLATAVLPSTASPAPAQQFERLHDGRFVIEIFGHALAFRVEDAGQVYFPTAQLPRSVEQYVFTSLEDYLDHPELAREAINSEEEFVRVWVSAWPRDESPFLGIFPKASLPEMKTPYPLTITVHRIAVPREGRGRTGSPQDLPGFTTVDGMGYAIIEPINLRAQKAAERIYVLPGSERIRPSEMNLVVWCRDATDKLDRLCSSEIRNKDGHIQVLWTWRESNFPQQTWRDLDARLQDVAGHILINSKRGELR